MGCKLVKASEYKNYKILEENQFELYIQNLKRANKRMEQIETILEVLTNDSRLKIIVQELENKNHNNINKDVLQQQDEKHEQSTTSEN